jgi:hypothetical protein
MADRYAYPAGRLAVALAVIGRGPALANGLQGPRRNIVPHLRAPLGEDVRSHRDPGPVRSHRDPGPPFDGFLISTSTPSGHLPSTVGLRKAVSRRLAVPLCNVSGHCATVRAEGSRGCQLLGPPMRGGLLGVDQFETCSRGDIKARPKVLMRRRGADCLPPRQTAGRTGRKFFLQARNGVRSFEFEC